MTVFTNNTSDLTGNVMNYIRDFKGYSRKQAKDYFNRHIVSDGGTYGEQARFHLSEKVTADAELLELILFYADRVAQ